MNLEVVLPVLWFGVIGFGVLMYVLLDGFVLGLGILAPFAEDGAQLDHMMNTAAPIWDGTETWLVLGGAGLLAAFPPAYALLLSSLYLPVLMMLIALIFRGVAFEFRFKATGGRAFWGAAFSIGSIVVAFSQGLILGALVEGLPRGDGGGGFASAFAWFSPFAMMTGVALVFGYALLGAGWLVLKTEGPLQQLARTLTRPLVLVVVAFMGLVSAWLPFLESRVMARWFESGHFWWLAPVPLLALVNAVLLWRAARAHGRDARPFILTLSFFALGFIGLVLGMWPNILPPDMSIWDAASPASSQVFLGVGIVILLPAILGYTWWSYSVFRGKVEADSGYHAH
jgi:cytochrome d ubiquinol oxidase subunit II